MMPGPAYFRASFSGELSFLTGTSLQSGFNKKAAPAIPANTTAQFLSTPAPNMLSLKTDLGRDPSERSGSLAQDGLGRKQDMWEKKIVWNYYFGKVRKVVVEADKSALYHFHDGAMFWPWFYRDFTSGSTQREHFALTMVLKTPFEVECFHKSASQRGNCSEHWQEENEGKRWQKEHFPKLLSQRSVKLAGAVKQDLLD